MSTILKGKVALLTVVWFHGGGITGGNRFVPEALKKQGIAVVAANYRLHPKVTCPTYIEDAAAAVAWGLLKTSKNTVETLTSFLSLVIRLVAIWPAW